MGNDVGRGEKGNSSRSFDSVGGNRHVRIEVDDKTSKAERSPKTRSSYHHHHHHHHHHRHHHHLHRHHRNHHQRNLQDSPRRWHRGNSLRETMEDRSKKNSDTLDLYSIKGHPDTPEKISSSMKSGTKRGSVERGEDIVVMKLSSQVSFDSSDPDDDEEEDEARRLTLAASVGPKNIAAKASYSHLPLMYRVPSNKVFSAPPKIMKTKVSNALDAMGSLRKFAKEVGISTIARDEDTDPKTKSGPISRSIPIENTLVYDHPINHMTHRSHQKHKLESSLLPPPPCVLKLIRGSVRGDDDATLKRLIRETVSFWLPEALAAASCSDNIKDWERRLLGTKLFTTNLLWAGCWDRLKVELSRRMLEMGRTLEERFQLDRRKNKSSRRLDKMLEAFSPALAISTQSSSSSSDLPGEAPNTISGRQDDEGLVPMPRGIEFDSTYKECCYIHYLRLIATAIDRKFQDTVCEVFGGAVITNDELGAKRGTRRSSLVRKSRRGGLIAHERPYSKGIKGYERMHNKMCAYDDHRFSRRPRPARNMDINRCLVVCSEKKKVHSTLVALRLRFGQFVKFKNGFALSNDEAADRFYLRFCLVNICFSHPKLRTIGDLCRDPETQELWQAYEASECPRSISRETWRNQIAQALEWLRNPAMARQPVRVACEVQIMLKETRDVRMEMHEMYKAWRAEDDLQLFRDFESHTLEKIRRKKFEEDGRRTNASRAARDGDVSATRKLIAQSLLSGEGAEDHDMLDLLHVACYYGRHRIVRLLLDGRHVKFDTLCGSAGLAALIYAIRGDGVHNRWTERGIIVARLLAASSEHLTELDDSTGMTALYCAAQVGHGDIVASILRCGVDVDHRTRDGYTALFVASILGNVNVVSQLLAAGANVLKMCCGCPTIVAAAQNGSVEVARLLLRAGARVNSKDEQGFCALHVACVRGHREIVALLLKFKANVNAVTSVGVTPLAIAAKQGFKRIVSLLLDARAYVDRSPASPGGVAAAVVAKKDVSSDWSAPPLHEAILKNRKDIVRMLIEAGADVNKVANEHSPLHLASRCGHYEIVEMLLVKGANPNVTTTDGHEISALHIAAKTGNLKTVDRLLASGASPRHVSSKGWSPLHFAAYGGHLDVARKLIQHPLTPMSSKTNSGHKPEHLAENPEVSRIIRKERKQAKRRRGSMFSFSRFRGSADVDP